MVFFQSHFDSGHRKLNSDFTSDAFSKNDNRKSGPLEQQNALTPQPRRLALNYRAGLPAFVSRLLPEETVRHKIDTDSVWQTQSEHTKPASLTTPMWRSVVYVK
ncbi:hypothetical protein RRG08_043282 [Elysia crispata]|uniref:Uncharacterized protein n=1 Tax=Elysia crispata TaxID=231223 RepID=A0AAE0XXI0_9GAST|nr:hypothetical protein RRG08_043282 [Elysia crispata]